MEVYPDPISEFITCKKITKGPLLSKKYSIDEPNILACHAMVFLLRKISTRCQIKLHASTQFQKWDALAFGLLQSCAGMFYHLVQSSHFPSHYLERQASCISMPWSCSEWMWCNIVTPPLLPPWLQEICESKSLGIMACINSNRMRQTSIITSWYRCFIHEKLLLPLLWVQDSATMAKKKLMHPVYICISYTFSEFCWVFVCTWKRIRWHLTGHVHTNRGAENSRGGIPQFPSQVLGRPSSSASIHCIQFEEIVWTNVNKGWREAQSIDHESAFDKWF